MRDSNQMMKCGKYNPSETILYLHFFKIPFLCQNLKKDEQISLPLPSRRGQNNLVFKASDFCTYVGKP